jgi:hemin uptake protein HemP
MSTLVLPLKRAPSSPAIGQHPSPLSFVAGQARHVSSHALLAGARELVIQHQGGEYRLRLTRNDKLILTK